MILIPFLGAGVASYFLREQGVLALGIANGAAALAAVWLIVVRSKRTTEMNRVHAQLSALLDNPRHGMILLDLNGKVSGVNLSAIRMLGLGGEKQARNLSFGDLPNEQDRAEVNGTLSCAFSGQGSTFRFGRVVDGQPRYFAATVMPVAVSSVPNQALVICEDVTAQRESEELLRERERRYALASRGANVGLWDWDISKNEMFYSERWKSMLGYGPQHSFERIEAWFSRVHPDDIESLQAHIKAHLKGETPHFESEHRMKMADGRYRWVLSSGLAARRSDGTAYRMAGSQSDINARRSAEERLMHDALHDPLTALPNRTLFMDRLRRALVRQQRRPEELFAVLFLDLDRFKVVNDSLGHSVGDQLLTAVAHRLGLCIRGNDTVARLGGE